MPIEDRDYKFYEISTDNLASDFNRNICYHLLDLLYLLLGFVLKPINNAILDTVTLNRHDFERQIRNYIAAKARANIQCINDI